MCVNVDGYLVSRFKKSEFGGKKFANLHKILYERNANGGHTDNRL
jgi:hypothetical protein